MTSLREHLRQTPYQAYSYSYPHKNAYRDLSTPVRLESLWATENRTALFGYIHIPFCSYRCGFCNLFALARPKEDLVDRYVSQLKTQMRVLGETLADHRFARFAIGGGTPSYLEAGQLEQILEAVHQHFNVDLKAVRSGIEVSPETVTQDRLSVCRSAGIDRVSMGVQSFIDSEIKSLIRPVQQTEVLDAVEIIRSLGFDTLNLDLIYGIPGQSVTSFLYSLEAALRLEPEELYLYPLYVRPQTGLGIVQQRRGESTPVDPRSKLYKAARDVLLSAGYRQVSMRMFRSRNAPEEGGPVYRCQDDGMVGIGCGARSYTRTLHYSDRYGVNRTSVSDILDRFVAAPEKAFRQADYGFVLDAIEQRRRYVIQSLLVWPGLDESAYTQRFGTDLFRDLPQLAELLAFGFARREGGLLALTEEGMGNSDTIGPWLNSEWVTGRIQSNASA